MRKVRFGKTELMVTPVAFGVLTIGKYQLNSPLKEGAELVRYAYDQGINFFDTAQYYETYDFIREAFKDVDMSLDNPDRPIIMSKCLDPSYEEMESAILECLEALEMDKIDIFLLHEIWGVDDWYARQGAWQCLKDYKAKGIISHIGISTHHVDVTDLVADIPEVEVVFPLTNYASLGIRKGDGTGTCEEMAEAIAKCGANDKGVVAMKAFGGGNLSGHYRQALDYVFSLDGMQVAMVGLGKKEEVDRLIEYAEGTLDEDYVPDISGKRMMIDLGDCEGCGACIERCPNHAIYRREEDGLAQVDDSICLTCGYCAPVCPVRGIRLL